MKDIISRLGLWWMLLWPGLLSAQEPVPVFKEQIIDENLQIGYGLEIGDVDGDGKPDILLADKKQFVWYRNGDWQRFVMVDNLTERDNVCLAARDIDGDGIVEVAVGAQWNPGETQDTSKSGSVHFLMRPDDPHDLWKPITLPHEPTVHRMKWISTHNGYHLVVLPLHGRGNVDGTGKPVNVLAYRPPKNQGSDWQIESIDESMHLTHNFDLVKENGVEFIIIGGKEGARKVWYQDRWMAEDINLPEDKGFGEIRKAAGMITGIQPMHGNELVVYANNGDKKVLTDSLAQGHALAVADLLDQGREQIIVGWRAPNKNDEIGIKLFIPQDPRWIQWHSIWVDRGGMACEDLKIADLDGDGRKEIIAAGRSTKNLKIYWNRTGS